MRLLVALALVGWLPGALLFRAPVLERARRERLAADERLYWAVVLSVAWSSALVLGLAAVRQYSFERLLVVNAAIALAAALAWRTRLRFTAAPRPGGSVLLPAVLVGLGVWLFYPPAEYVIGGKDPGVYVSEGIQIAQRGALVTRDPVVAAVPAQFRDLFFPSHEVSSYYGTRFMGFFILNPDAGTVIGQFPQLYPAWIAVGYGLAGLNGALHVLGAAAILGVLGVYFVGSRLAGRAIGFAGAALVTVSVVQIWFARYPNAETLTQALLFAALLAFARAHVDDDLFFAPVAGALLGLLLFCRFDTVLAIAGVGSAAILLALAGRPVRWSFLLPLALTSVLAVLYFALFLTPYAARPIAFLQTLGWMWLAGGALVVLLGAGALLLARHPAHAVTRIVERWWPRLLIAVVAGLALYAFFFRVAGGRLAPHDANSLRTFAWYLPAAGIGAALIGFALLGWTRFWRDPGLFMVTAVYAVFVFYKVQIVPEHFWMARRFVPVILPMALLLAAAGILLGMGSELRRPVAPRRFGAAGDRFTRVLIRLVLLYLLGAALIQAARPILGHVEYRGILPRIEALAGRFDDRDLLIVESRNASDLHVLALPLAYIHARNVLVLNTPKPDKAAFAAFLEHARERYDEIYFLGGGGTDLLSRRIGVEAIASERFQVPEYESIRNGYPTRARMKEFDFGLYKFTADAADLPWFTLDVGAMDDLHVVRFHAKERNARGRTFRWTRTVSYVSILGIQPDSSALTLWMENGGRPATAGPALLEVFLDDRKLGEVTVSAEPRPYTFAVPRELAAAAAGAAEPALLRLVSTTWNPRAALGVSDDRDLGVMLYRVEVR